MVDTIEKDAVILLYRDGPIPVVRRGAGALRWSCHPTRRHAHRWYPTAWICWRLTPRRGVRLVVGLLVGLTMVGLVAAWWGLPAPQPHDAAAPPTPAPASVPPGPPSLTPEQWACVLERLRGRPCVPATVPRP
jgi:hypothetical protein